MKKITRLLFVLNAQKASAHEIAENLSGIARENGVETSIYTDFPVEASAFKGFDACCVIGGDGTMLSCLNGAVEYDIPIFGINLGKLGFLASFSDISKETFLKLVNGDCRIVERTLLTARLPREGKNVYLSLNDLVFRSKSALNISTMRVSVDGELIADYSGDGLIFSTPTGSTAYNLSAGGPLIHPKAKVYVMTPICPHTLSNRSLVLSNESKVTVQCVGKDAVLICDGREDTHIDRDDEIEISSPPKTMKFFRLKGHSHFKLLRSKFGWAEDPRSNLEKK